MTLDLSFALGRRILSVGYGWEEDIPEIWRGSIELHGDEGTLGVHLRRTHYVNIYPLLGLHILQGKFGSRWQTFGKNNHSAVGADGVCEAVQRIVFAGNVHHDWHL